MVWAMRFIPSPIPAQQIFKAFVEKLAFGKSTEKTILNCIP